MAKLLDVLHDVPVSFHRRALRHCFRFMSGYRQGLTGPLLDYDMKKHRSHRQIPRFVEVELRTMEAAEHKKLYKYCCNVTAVLLYEVGKFNSKIGTY